MYAVEGYLSANMEFLMHCAPLRQVSALVLVLLLLFSQTSLMVFAKDAFIPQSSPANESAIGFDLDEVKTKPDEAPVKLEKLPVERTDSLLSKWHAQVKSFSGAPEKQFAKPVDDRPAPQIVATANPFTVTLGERQKVSPLAVTEALPIGATGATSAASIHFSQQMVPLSGIGQMNEKVSDVSIEPPVSGSWQWLDTETLQFKSTGLRLPMATTFNIKVGTGLNSVKGGALIQPYSWSFSTPPIQSVSPTYSKLSEHQFVAILFDQKVAASDLLPFVQMQSKKRKLHIAAATEQELAPYAETLKELRPDGEPVAIFKILENFPSRQTVVVDIAKNCPSAEGTIRSEHAFRIQCEVGPEPVLVTRPTKILPFLLTLKGAVRAIYGETLRLAFNARIGQCDANELITVTPKLADQQVHIYDREIQISGRPIDGARHVIHISSALSNVEGTRLNHDLNLPIAYLPCPSRLYNSSRNLQVLHPQESTTYPVYSVNVPALYVETFKISEDESLGSRIAGLYNHVKRNRISESYVVTKCKWNHYCKTDVPLSALDLKTSNPISMRVTACSLADVKVGLTRIRKGVPEQQSEDQQLESAIGANISRQNGKQVGKKSASPKPEPPRFETCVQVTDLGVSTYAGSDGNLYCWVTNLVTGAPESGAKVTLRGRESACETDSSGLTKFAGFPRGRTVLPALLEARQGERRAIANVSIIYEPKKYLAKAFTDRGLYRPGESVQIKGWLRERGPEHNSDLEYVSPPPPVLKYKVVSARQKEITHGDLHLDNLQSFHLAFSTEKDVDLGTASLLLMLPDGKQVGSTTFAIEEFRPPEFSMSLQKEDSRSKYLTDAIKFTAQAKYFSSGPLSRSKVDWTFNIQTAAYSPPGLGDFAFQNTEIIGDEKRRHSGYSSKKIVGRSDIDGADVAQAKITAYDDTNPLLVTAEASVTDLSSQKWSKQETCLVHPAKIYVGLKTNSNYVAAGQHCDFSVVVADVDGHKVSKTATTLELFKLPDNDASHYSPSKPELVETMPVNSADEPSSVSFKLPSVGRFAIRASVKDDTGHRNESTLRVFAYDPKEPRPDSQLRDARSWRHNEEPKDEKSTLVLKANKKIYKLGETAEVIASSPYKHCIGLLTLINNGVAQITELQSTNGTLAYNVPILPSYIPSVHATLTLHSLDPASDGDEELTSTLDIPVTSDSRKLQIKATPRRRNLNPGDTNQIDFVALRADGQPAANANICAIVVDESILALNGYDIPDPIPYFYSGCSSAYTSTSSREYDARVQVKLLEECYLKDLCPTNYNQLAQLASVHRYTYYPSPRGYHPGRSIRLPEDIGRVEGPRDLNLFQVEPTVIDERHYTSGRDERHQKTSPTLPEGSPIPDEDQTTAEAPTQKPTKSRIRTDFGPLALFAPNIKTNELGHATVAFQVPDSLTRYRVFVIGACEDKYFGKTESNFIVDQPVTLRPSIPRFANIGDQFDVPFIVTNTSNKVEKIEVAACAEGAATGTAGYKLSLLPNQRKSIYVHAKSTTSGNASIRGIAVASGFEDRVARAFPVIQSLTTEQVATYGSISRDAVNKTIQIPTPESTSGAILDISGSASAITELQGAASYLIAYPFSCSEQLSSQILAFSAIKGMPQDLAELLATRNMVEHEQETVDALCNRQQPDGGFVLWPASERYKEIPYVSIHASHALAAAEEAGYSVNPEVLEKAVKHLDSMRLENKKLSTQTRQSLLAYACYTEHLLGKDSVHRAEKLLDGVKLRDVPVDVLCWLAPVLNGKKTDICNLILERLRSTASETASTAFFTDTNQNARDLFSCSDNRLNSLALEALVMLQPESLLIPKVAKGLLLGRQHGHWLNTSDDSFAFSAMNKYFNLYEKESPDFALNIWFDGQHYLDRKITQRKDKIEKVNFNLVNQLASDLTIKDKSQSLVVQTQGPGRFYYRLGMQYSMKDPIQKELDRGFKIARHYEGVTNKDDVVERPDGSVRIKKGATVRIVTELVVPSHRYYVAMVDHLPAAFESINTKLLGNSNEDSQPENWYEGTRRVSLGLSTRRVAERLLDWSWGDFFQNLRDDRTEIFRDNVPPGYYRYAYLARATSTGRFLAPAASVEEMYEPETFGHSDSFYVEVVSDGDE